MQECRVSTVCGLFGPVTVVETKNGVRNVDEDDGARQFLREMRGELMRLPGEAESAKEFEAYFAGKLHVFSAPLDPCGTEFQQRVWREAARVPYGELLTYGELALRIGTRGFRSVGQALRRCTLGYIVPCHRIVGANGPGGGIDLSQRRALLEFEGISWPADWPDVPPSEFDRSGQECYK